MSPTILTLWHALSGIFPRKAGPRRRPVESRPSLEVLEDRAVPASLSWSNGTFSVYGTALDSAGNVYITGDTGSSLPATAGAFETSGSGAYAAKLSPTGALIYATYLGSGGNTGFGAGGYGIAVDAAGDAYVIGMNPNLPTTANALAASASGNVFVAELNPTGSALVYSTYLPAAVGFAMGNAGGIAVDGSGNVYVTGCADTGFPVTAGAYQSSAISGGASVFFAEINPTLSGSASLTYSSYLGSGQGYGIALDASGNAYLTGLTQSTSFPTTSGAFQRTYGGGFSDVFVAKFNPSLSGASSLVYSTYLGGSGQDGFVCDDTQPFDISPLTDVPQTDGGIAVNAAGDAFVTAATTSTNFPTTRGAFQTSSNLTWKKGKSDSAPADAFVTEINPTGTALVYSTYLGGGTNTWSGGASIALDANGDAEVTGWTSSTVFPTKNPIQARNGGGYDAFVTVLNPSGSGLLFSTYYGGSGNDNGFAIALDSSGNAYVGGNNFVILIDPPAGRGETGTPKPPIASHPAVTAIPPARTILLRGGDVDVLFALLDDAAAFHKGHRL